MFPERTGKKFNFYALLKILFSCQQVNLCGRYEGDPLSPPEGRATPGEIPLTSFPGYFYQSSEGCRIWGMPWRRGRRHDVPEPLRAIIKENG
jgi:hypothetical protein